MSSDDNIYTPYANLVPFFVEEPMWAPETERERVQSYGVYDELYWNYRKALKLMLADDRDPVYLPTPRTIVDSTSHFLLKGLRIAPKSGEGESPFKQALDAFFKREKFMSKFHTNKLAGVRRGDAYFHLTADPNKPVGSRLSINGLDPASVFPIWDDDDIDKLLGMDIVTQWEGEDGKPRIKRLRYMYEFGPNGRMVWMSEGLYEVEGWWKGKAAKVVQIFMTDTKLDPRIDTIPVFHFKNLDDVENPFGSSELRGFEQLIQSINQSVTDEDVALALEGLGVYATDAQPPVNEAGEEEPWIIGPGRVLETPGGTFFKRVEGVGSVKPMQDHIQMLADGLYEASATFRPSQVDVLTAESGVAMAIKFMPTLAKIETRDQDGLDNLEQLFYNWRKWHDVHEGQLFTDELEISIGDKLPESRKEKLNELNNMKDRDVISAKYFRAEMAKLGYIFPNDEEMEDQIFKEKERALKLQQMLGNNNNAALAGGDPKKDTIPGNDNASNNAKKPNESGGTEAT